ncbi:uncharacterized protein G2W53_041511 [Senna tora]|uniref:RNase H type-1 domain-containing protein n=1 Tax=Senna tora TaxID=362788 RepID=A0A834VZ85_9FABA|nr:uncharacterized protein G2W53_041511 [Senna tora]
METNTMAYREKDDDSLVIYDDDDDDVLSGVERCKFTLMGKLIASKKVASGGSMEKGTEKIARKLCSTMGEVLEVGLFEEQSSGSMFMKGLIVFDLEKPVRKGANLGNINDGIHWVDFRKVDFKSKELEPWLRAESVGKRVAWSISSNASQGSKNSVEERKIGVVRKIDSDDLLKKLERMTMCEKKNDRVPTSLSNGGEEVMYTQSKIGKEEGVMVTKEVGVTEVKKGVEGYGNLVETGEGSVLKEKSGNGEVGPINMAMETEGGTLHREEDVKGDSEKGIGSKTIKGGVKKWKRVAREKENVVPMIEIKKHLFNDLTNAKEDLMESSGPIVKKGRHGLIRESWEEGRYMGGTGVEGSLEMLKESLTQWNKKVFENVNHKIRKLQEELRKLYKVPDGRLNIEKDVLRMGLLRLVGDGDATKIFGDPWVLGVENMTLHPRPGGLDFNANVSLLLDVTGRWRMDAYHAIHKATQEQATDMEYGHVLSRIWKMKTLPSTKLFIWRAMKNILPTGNALSRRGMDVDGACIICKTEAETGFHAVIGCKDAQRFWKTTNLPFVDERDDETDFKEWMNALWFNGHQKSSISSPWLLKNYAQLIEDTVNESKKWQPPSWRFLKLNVDASVRDGGQTRVGCIIRDYMGRCLAAMTKEITGCYSVEMAEALAVYEGMVVAKRMSILNVLVEGDSASVIKLLNGEGMDCTYVSFIIKDILQLCSSFRSYSFNWVRREANKVAHILAHDPVAFPSDNSGILVWLEDYPSLICNALKSDILT